MATLVSFHAHPDDECITCAGVMRKASDEGHRVVLVVATRGEHGEVEPGFLDDGEQLSSRRVAETLESAGILGVHRTEFLGYLDSGMMGTSTNDAPGSFWQAPIDEAAERLAAILQQENADVLTVYDDNGGYGHPDHIQVHRVGLRAAELAGTPRVYQQTTNRDHLKRGMAAFRERASTAGSEDTGSEDTGPEATGSEATGSEATTGLDPDFVETLGKPEAEITAAVDVSAYVGHKRRAMRAHASQISEQSFWLTMPDDAFAYSFGTEWYIRDGQGPGITETDLMTGLRPALS